MVKKTGKRSKRRKDELLPAGFSMWSGLLLAKYLTELIEKEENLELLAPTAMNIVCFRFKKEGMDQEILNKLNEEIVLQLQERGIAVPSHTTLNGNYAIKVAITNHVTKREDLKTFVNAVKRIAKEIEAAIL